MPTCPGNDECGQGHLQVPGIGNSSGEETEMSGKRWVSVKGTEMSAAKPTSKKTENILNLVAKH